MKDICLPVVQQCVALKRFGASAGQTDIRTILDFACGYGRVLRFLEGRFPTANITSSDMDPGSLEFLRRAFFVQTAISNLSFNELSVSDRFDLVGAGH